jgi:hypothetical protein
MFARVRLGRFGYRSGTNLVAVAVRGAQAEHGCSAAYPRATDAPGPRRRVGTLVALNACRNVESDVVAVLLL